MQKLNFLWKYEKFFFGTLILIFLLPVITIRFFPTVDGPSHLYNSNLLTQLWFKDQTEVISFFDVNTRLDPNWINHILFAVLNKFFPSFIVEKSILLLYLILLPLSFRQLIKILVTDSKRSVIASYLIFPFIYSFPFCMGFFNFCIGIPILFFCIIAWIKNEQHWNVFRVIVLLILTTLLYFAHLFNFLLFGFIIVCYETQKAIELKHLKNMLFLVVVTLPGLILSAQFIFSNQGYEASKYIDKGELLKGITELSPIITLNYEKEQLFACIIFYCFCVLICAIIYNRIKNTIRSNNSYWLIAAIVILVLYFMVPDWMVSGGFISIRLGLFFFLVLIIWISTSTLSIKQMLIPMVVMIGTSLCFLKYHYEEVKNLSDDVVEITSGEQFIEEGKTLLPLNYSTNWLHSNFSNYMGAQKFVIILDNYEATKPHFPLIWKRDQNPYTLIGNFGNSNPCITIKKYEEQTGHTIDYISRWYYNAGITDSCSVQANRLIQDQYNLIYTSPNSKLQLFKRK